MIVTADWVLPITGPPLRNGAVAVRGRVIEAVGPLAEMTARYPERAVSVHADSVLVPGLVNAHTHLCLSALEGLIGPMPFPAWLERVAAASRALDADDFAASAAWGAVTCLMAGVTAVGDIAYGPESLSATGDIGPGGVFFWEVLGITETELARTLDRLEFPRERECGEGRFSCGISPHAPYTSGPALLRATHRLARERGIRHMLHLAESPAEERLMRSGDGPLAEVATRNARGFTSPGAGAVTYAHDLGVLEGTIAVHCVTASETETRLLARHARGVVLCPRSNRYLQCGAPPVAMLRSAGAALAIGSDSVASNEGVDLFAEARALAAMDPGLTPERLLAMMTLEGARVLGIEHHFGSLEPGKQADLVAIATPATGTPAETLVGRARPADVRAVMTAGAWRVLDGQPVGRTARIEAAMRVARAKAERVLSGTFPGRRSD